MIELGIAKAKRMDNNEWTKGYVFYHDKFGDKSELEAYLVTTGEGDRFMEKPVDFKKVYLDTVCFFTDKRLADGTEIFTGDDIEFYVGALKSRGVVEWSQEDSQFVIAENYDGITSKVGLYELQDSVTVKGNIYDTFNLSKKEIKKLKKESNK